MPRVLFLSLLLAAACHCALPARAQPPDTIDGRTFYLPLVLREAEAQDLPPEIADAVAMVETGYHPEAVGGAGEIGLMQVMPATASQLGFRGTLADLADPATNIRLGVAYLARAWAAGGGDLCRALTKYRAGLGEEAVTPLSARYCARAVALLMGGLHSPMPRAGAHAWAPTPLPPDANALAMPAARPPMPAGVRLVPILAMSARGPRHPSHTRQNAAEPAARRDPPTESR